ncbi:hypothetical protein [Geobacter sp. SVR]|uniref:hypothetical protein n=1 Tax=Geobacter sp. SVR TaxID=2495594 RepID=UPI00143EF6BF|nr:hypothetical protein [Geobacter sp. SVR]BCS53299.1 hypothetical protein GSVR_16070 [Geobacter sp. SVR]GCF85575.1 hypothetical protein GSbR_21750 [Geobacter sp. SVR]
MTIKDISWKTWGAALVALFVFSWFIWNHFKATPNVTQGNWSAPKPVASISEEVKPGPKKIVTLNKEEASIKLNLPPEATKASTEVLTSADIKTKNSRVAAVAYMNMSTGRTSIIAQEIPHPFLRFENVREVGIRGGINTSMQTVGDVHARFQFAGIGPAKLGVYGELNGQIQPVVKLKEGKAMLDLSVEW